MRQIIDETRADTYTGYLTGKNNFRDLVATLQRYKGNRYDKNGKRITVQPVHLAMCRLHLENEWGCKICHGQEADDALSIHQNQNIYVGKRNLSVISTIDKDLLINSGLHHDMNNGEMFESNGFGEIWMKGSACKGYGLKFFCAQLLMGDSADWIKGLPKVTPNMKEWYGIKRLGGCGAKSAFMVIDPCTSYIEAMWHVTRCYDDFWHKNSYKHWNNEKLTFGAGPSTAYNQLEEQGQLLWMRQIPDQMWSQTMKESSPGRLS